MSEHTMTIRPIGVIRTPFRQAAGTPIQPAAAAGAEGSVEIFPQYAAGLKDLDGFERVWLVYWFDRAGPPRLAVRPFLDDVERGLFATRAPSRPNPIGISPVRLLAVEGAVLRVAEVDVLDGTPLLDIKPYAPQFDCFPAARAGWLAGRSPAGRADDGRFGGQEDKP